MSLDRFEERAITSDEESTARTTPRTAYAPSDTAGLDPDALCAEAPSLLEAPEAPPATASTPTRTNAVGAFRICSLNRAALRKT